MSRHLRYFLGVTDDLSDAEFETTVNEIRTVRRTRREAVAYERAMIAATDGVSLRYAPDASPEGLKYKLIASYSAAGMTPREIEQRLRELNGQ